MTVKILAINPGSTSTKFAVYENEHLLLEQTIRHSAAELSDFPTVSSQYELRKNLILKELERCNIKLDFQAIVGRGGLLKPIPGGIYEVNDKMKYDLSHPLREHASNLGGLIAAELAANITDCKAYIADAVVTDELEDIARVTGSPLIPRRSIFHALNQKAVARKYAGSINTPYEELNIIVAHLGGGISVGAHKNGRVIDVNNALDGSGPFSPERAGTFEASDLAALCFSGDYTHEEVKKMICGKGGLLAHLGNTNVGSLLTQVEKGDEKVDLVLRAMFYNVAKQIGAMAVALHGKVDAILLTGGIAYNEGCMEDLKEQIRFLAPVYIYPGEDELEALAMNGLRVIKGEIVPKVYS